MNILAIDYGTKRIGLAWVDTALGVVLPFGVIRQSDFRFQTSAITDLVKREKIDQIVVGFPIGLDGGENENTVKVCAFIDQLKSEVRLPIATVDERFTTHQAARAERGVSADERAAMIILQSYLDRH